DKFKLRRGGMPVAPRGQADWPARVAKIEGERDKQAFFLLIAAPVAGDNGDAVTVHQQPADQHERARLHNPFRARMMLAGEQIFEDRPRRRALPRGHPRIAREILDGDFLLSRQRMAGPHDQRKLVIEDTLLHNVVDRRRIAERADQEVNLAVAKAMQEILVAPVDDADLDIGAAFRDIRDSRRQDMRAGKRHGTNDDAAAVDAFIGPDLHLSLLQFGEGKLDVAGENFRGWRKFDPLPGLAKERDRREPLEIARGAVEGRLGNPDKAGSEAEIAGLGDGDQRAKLHAGDELVEIGKTLAAPDLRDLARLVYPGADKLLRPF